MLVASLSSFPLGVVRWSTSDSELTVVLKATFDLRSGELSEAQRPVYAGDEIGSGSADEPSCATDRVPRKARCDVFVVGHAKTSQPRDAWGVEIRLGGLLRRLHCVGPRPASQRPLRQPFLRAIGNGSARTSARGTAALLSAPAPGGDYSQFNSAPPEQQLERMDLAFPMTLVGLVGEGAATQVPMPTIFPEVWVVPKGGEPQRMPLRCDTVTVFTDEEELTLTWRGGLARASSDVRLVVARASLSERREASWERIEAQLGGLAFEPALELEAPDDADADEIEQTVALELSETPAAARRAPVAPLTEEESTILEELSELGYGDIIEEISQADESSEMLDEDSFAGSRFTDAPLESSSGREPQFAMSDEPPPTPRNGIKLGSDGFAPLGGFVLSSGHSSPLPPKPPRKPSTPQMFVARLADLAETLREKQTEAPGEETTTRVAISELDPDDGVITTPWQRRAAEAVDDTLTTQRPSIAIHGGPLDERSTQTSDDSLPTSVRGQPAGLVADPSSDDGASTTKLRMPPDWQRQAREPAGGLRLHRPAVPSRPKEAPAFSESDLLPLETYASIKVEVLRGVRPLHEILDDYGVGERAWKIDELRRVAHLAAAAKAGDTDTVLALREAMARAMQRHRT